MLYQLTSSGFRCFCPFIAAAVSSHRRKGPVFSPHLGRTRGVRPPFLPGGIVCPAPKKETPAGVSFFVGAHRFCCLHSRPPQGRGSVRGEPLTGSPTRVQSPARRRPLLRSKSAAPKKKDTHVGVFLFWSGRRGSNSLPRPWQGRALPDELRPQAAPLLQRLWCLRPGSNRRHADFQSAALPTELQRHMATKMGLEPTTSSVTGWRSNQLNYLALFLVGTTGLEPVTPCL